MPSNAPAAESARHRLAERGFGLLELAIALVVLSIGVLGLVSLVPMGTKSAAKSGEVTRASELTSALAERLLSTPFDHTDLLDGTHTSLPSPVPGGYYLTWRVESDQPIPECKRVTIQARWPKPTSPNPSQLVIVIPKANDQ